MKIYVNTDSYKKSALKTGKDLTAICDELDIEITENIKESDVICSIGGDGTFLESSKIADGKPILGINCGTLGFLSEIKPEEIKKALSDFLNKNYEIDNRMMLEGEIIKASGEKIKIPPALNEISLSKNSFGVVRFDAIADGEIISSYTADGIIVSTPTGSTAYNLSCGGPIVDPTAEIITLTPIAPHTILNRSIVLSNESTVKIKITELRNETEAYALYDGNPIEVQTGDIVEIKKSDYTTRIIKLKNESFVEKIRKNIS